MSKNGSKALRNMLPNSRMDRQHRPKQFFRQKNRVEDFERIEKIYQDKREKQWEGSEEQEKKEAEEALAYLESLQKKQSAEEQEIQLAAQKLGCTPDHVRYLISIFEKEVK